MRCNRFSAVLAIAVVAMALFAGAANAALVDEDFQSPLYSNGTSNPSFTGWTISAKSRTSASESDVPCDDYPTTNNQVIHFEQTSYYAQTDIAHGWDTGEFYTLTLNASPQSWHGADDRYIAPSLRQQDNTVLWSRSTLMPKYDNFGRNPWTADQTFTYYIDPNAFTTGSEGELLRLKIAHTDSRGIFVDNVNLTAGAPPVDNTPPTPDPITWKAEPAVFDYTNAAMTANPAIDPYDVEYLFENTVRATSSGWQDGTYWFESGLDPATNYTYRTKARDKSPNQNETGWSSLESVTTPPEVPGLIFASGFQTPMDGSISFPGWAFAGAVGARTAPSDGVPGDPAIPNQVIQFEWTSGTAKRDTSHPWSADEVYTLTLNASPQQWHGDDDRYLVPSLLQANGTLLWSDSVMLPKYDDFAGNPWPEELTFTFEIDGSTFTTGTEGEPLSVKIASSGSRGIYIDNVMLTYASAVVIPEPSTLAIWGLGLLGLLLYARRRRSGS